MVTIDPNDLRLTLGLPDDQFDTARAELLLRRAVARIRGLIGAERFDRDVEPGSTEADAVEDVALAYASRLWVNPEAGLQFRLGDFSRSLSDSVDAAAALTPGERSDLRRAFGINAQTLNL